MEKHILQTFLIDNDTVTADDDTVAVVSDDDGHLHWNMYDNMLQLTHNTSF
jgi:hypothetical protein